VPRPTWVATRIDRARRRLRATPSGADDAATGAVADPAVSIARSELERLMTAQAASLDPALPSADSPARRGHIHTARAGGTTRSAPARLTAGERLD